ncbi:MAG: hypothetical protein LBC19_16050 [Tannerella sp.]|jgi:hypothetical protein|nr:hypothetical protein [Tannerella sp.]
MEQYSKQMQQHKRVMESGDHFNNEANPKSFTNRIKAKTVRFGMLTVTCIALGIPVNSHGIVNMAVSESTRGPSVSTPSRRMEVQVTNIDLIDNGKTFLLEFWLINHGEEIYDYRFYHSYDAYDNFGNQCAVNIIWGQKKTHGANTINGKFPEQTPVKMQMTITGFDSWASSFSQIKFKAEAYSSNNSEGSEGDYIFRNIAIPQHEESQGVGNTMVLESTRGAGVSTPSRRMEVQVTNSELIDNGKTFLLEFLLINHGEEIYDYRFYHSYDAYDNFGNQCAVNIIWGQKKTHGANTINGKFPEQTPVKMQMTVTGFHSQATSFSLIKFKAEAYSSNNSEGTEGDYIFRNIMIPW